MLLKKYSQLNFCIAELENSDQLPAFGCECMRVSIPTDYPNKQDLVNKGFVMVDRTIDVKVPIGRSEKNFLRFCRMTVFRTEKYVEEIRKIARASFQEDYRFKISLHEQKNEIYDQLIDSWLEGQKEVFVCLYKEQAIGFADVRCLNEYGGMPFIYLAAVDERYRTTGAAISLYASVFEYYKEQKMKFVYGKISSQNIATINLYASFGAQFLRSCDIYIKEGNSNEGEQY